MNQLSANTYRERLVYWLQDEPIQNFGDYLTAYLADKLFVQTPRPPGDIRLIGSCLHDDFVSKDQRAATSGDGSAGFALTAWGAGAREPGGLSRDAQKAVNIVSVRGPLSASELRLGAAIPLGDPGLLLPALYQPRPVNDFVGKAICVPHFHDQRTDAAIASLTGADLVLRPAIRKSLDAIETFIDSLTSARFVLCGSLHAAIAAAAYGKPFAMWDSGSVDLPFKWSDFAASVGIPVEFQRDVDSGLSHHETRIRPVIRLPTMWKVLAVAPYLLRPAAVLRVLRHEQGRANPGVDLPMIDDVISIFESGTPCLEQIASDANSLVDSLAARVDELSTELTQLQARARSSDDSATNWSTNWSERVDASAAEIGRLLTEVHDTGERLRNSDAQVLQLTTRVDELSTELTQMRARARSLEDSTTNWSERVDASAAEIKRLLTEARDSGERLRNSDAQVLQLTREMDQVVGTLARIEGRPLASISKWLQHLLLMRLASWRAVLPQRMRDRFRRSAAKRAPGRHLERWATLRASLQIDARTTPAGPDSRPGPQADRPGPQDLVAAFESLHGTAAIYFPPIAEPEVSIIIPAYKGLDDLLSCLRSISIHRVTEPPFEVIVIDDCPSDPVLPAIPLSGGLRTVANDENLGFLHSCRRAAGLARGRTLCFLNSDTIATAGWLACLTETLHAAPRIGLVGGMLLNRDGSIQDAGWRILSDGWGHPLGRGFHSQDGTYTHRRPVDCVTGACFVIAAERWWEVDGFDPLYAPAFYEEFDLSFRLKVKGYETIYDPRSRVIHLGSASYGPEARGRLSVRNHAKFAERFAQQLQKQPVDASDSFNLLWAGPRRPVILVVDLSVPEPNRHAGDVTIFSYLSLLAESGWRVIFGPRNGQTVGPHAEALEAKGVQIVRSPTDVEDWLRRYGSKVDQILLCRVEIAFDLVDHVRATSKARLSYYTHDLHFLRMQREAELRRDPNKAEAAARMRTKELGVLQAVDQILTPSGDEGTLIQSLLPGCNPIVVPAYFFDDDQIRHRDAVDFGACNDIVFVGGFPHVPNVDAALFIVNEIMPLVWQSMPDVRLLLIGYAPPPEVRALAGPRVIVTGQVAELSPWLASARLLMAALRYGAGVKGKVVEALRVGLPVVGTPIAAEGIGITPGREALIEEDPAHLAQAALELLSDPERCAELSKAGAALVRGRFSREAAQRVFKAAFEVKRCGVCGSTRVIDHPPTKVIRECFVCADCFALARSEALGSVARDRLGVGGEAYLGEVLARRPSLRLHEFGFVGAIAETLRGLPNYSTSEFFVDVPPGEMGPHGVRCEDLMRLTFPESSFDVVISQDVMEHVPEPIQAFSEIARVLRPGGRHFFTIPQSRNLARSVTRARLGVAGIEHILPAEYHGDPIRSEGALVFTDFGLDLAEMIAASGLTLVEHDLPVVGSVTQEVLRVFEAFKPISLPLDS